jgi:hypothetical protein
MKLFKTSLAITVALVVTVIAAPVAQADNPTRAQLRALEIRGQAMNRLCDDPTLTADAYRALCGKPASSKQQVVAQLRALEIRGQAMNHLCDGSRKLSAEAFEALCGVGAAPTVQAVASTGFDWGDFGIGAGAMLGLVLLTGGTVAGLHYGRKSSVRPRTVS